jgi:hypothetical protein
MRFDLAKFLMVAVGIFALAVLLLMLYMIAGPLLGDTFMAMAGGISMILMLLSGALLVIIPLIGIVEVATSKNDAGYKVLWIVVLLLFGILGLGAYLAIGKKGLK